jgi:hypothetical protein
MERILISKKEYTELMNAKRKLATLDRKKRMRFIEAAFGVLRGHIPPDLVVDQWTSDAESSSPPYFLLRHDLSTTCRRLMMSQITSTISTVWDFTTKSGGIWETPPGTEGILA